MSATMEDALTEALLWLKDEPADNELSEARFGRYADGSGFWWTLDFRRYVRTGVLRENRQDNEKRIGMIVSAWSAVRPDMDRSREVPA